MSDLELLAQYERVVVRLRKYLPSLRLGIEKGKWVIENPLDGEEGGAEQILFTTTSVRELDVFVEGLRAGVNLERCGEVVYP
jgi:hypothetical protein